jgi:prefoldin subunit 5
MPSPTIERLLVLQDRDTSRLGIEAQLRAVPVEIASVEQRIAAEKAAIESAKGELRELETRKKSLETEIGSAEAQKGKYQTQQLAVKKNDEYQALGHEIENVQKQIDELEGRELETMYAIDEARKRFAAAEATPQAEHRGPRGAYPLDDGAGGQPVRGAQGVRGGGGRSEVPGRGGRPPGLRPGRPAGCRPSCRSAAASAAAAT